MNLSEIGVLHETDCSTSHQRRLFSHLGAFTALTANTPVGAWTLNRREGHPVILVTSVACTLHNVVWPSHPGNGCFCLRNQVVECCIPEEAHVAEVYNENATVLGRKVDLVRRNRLVVDYLIIRKVLIIRKRYITY